MTMRYDFQAGNDTCVILQPSYIPWRGYFHQIQKADVFVFYDDVEYDKRGWRNRNRLKAPGGSRWVTVPVASKGCRTAHATIGEVKIKWDQPWNRKHWETIRHLYGKAPYFPQYDKLLQTFFRGHWELLADFTIDFTITLAKELGVERTRFLRASSLKVEGHRTDRLLAILQCLGAKRYVTGPAARDYLEEDKLRAAGISVEYMTYDYPQYPQLYPPFDPQVSILDLLLMTGPDASRYIW